MRKLTLDEMSEIAAMRGGHCLSTEYIDQSHDIEWECAEGHRWLAPGGQVKGSRNKPGTWCPTCAPLRVAEKRRLTIADMQRLAAEHGGQFLSTEYLGSCEKHLWACSEYPGHPAFEQRPNATQQGQWCGCCARNVKPTLADLDSLAKAKNPEARSLAREYVNSAVELEWTCGVAGHPPFFKSYRSVKYDGGWCRLCRTYQTKYTRGMLEHLAESLGGALLSTEAYRNTKQPLEWRCADGHIFRRTLDSIRSYHSFCPDCSRTWNLREQYVRSLFAHLMGASFPRRRDLPWLVNAAGARMELDGYNAELQIAFEYHGSQHYGVDGLFLKDFAALERRQADDARKAELCDAYGIILITVPHTVAWTNLQRFVTDQLMSRGVVITDSSHFEPGVVSVSRIEELQEKAGSLGGSLLSNRYLGSAERLQWKCGHGDHPPFSATPSSVLSGSWCDKCADEQNSARYRVSIDKTQEWALAAGGQLLISDLSPAHFDDGLRLQDSFAFECFSCGAARHRTVRQVKNGRLCLCVTKKVRTDRAKIEAVIAGRGISIVGPEEIHGGRDLVELRCESCNQHWTKRASSVVNNGDGHRSCTRAVTIEKALAAGERSGFTLLSAEVHKGDQPLEWKCTRAGHLVTLPYREMRSRRRCAECASKQASIGLLGSIPQ